MESYKPKVVESGNLIYAEVLVQLKRCPECKKPMLHVPRENRKWSDTFPHYHAINLEAQMKAAGWAFRGSSTNAKEERICVECEAAGKAKFKCALCGETRHSDDIQDSFGDPADYLCKPCYGTVPAKQWDEIYRQLQDSHRYDFD